MRVPLGAPLGNLVGLGVLALLLEDEALAVERLGVVVALLERPRVVHVCVVQVAHFLVARSHVVAELPFQEFEFVELHLAKFDLISDSGIPLDVTGAVREKILLGSF